MTKYKIISWVRDRKGKVISRPLKNYCNAVTTFVGGGHADQSGLGNTTPYVFELKENQI